MALSERQFKLNIIFNNIKQIKSETKPVNQCSHFKVSADLCAVISILRFFHSCDRAKWSFGA